MHLNKFREAVRLDLWSVRKLGIQRVQQALLSLIQYNIPGEFVPMMQDCLIASKKDSELIEYLRVMDLLLENPIYNQILHSSLIEFYPSIVYYLSKYGHKKEVEDAKIIRKYWVGRLHPSLYFDLQRVTLRKTGIDVDQIFNSHALFNIQRYYSKVLGLSPQEINSYLPQTSQTSFFTQGQPKIPQHQLQFGTNAKNAKSLPPTYDDRNAGRPSNDLIVHNQSLYYKQPLPDFSIGKRIRYESQETNPGGSVDRYDCPRKIPPRKIDESRISCYFQQQVQPINHYEKSLPEVQAMLDKINFLHPIECQECGLRFDIPEQLKEHKENHVKEKFKAYEDKESRKMGTYVNEKFYSLKTSDEWSLNNIDLGQVEKESLLLEEIFDINEFDLNCPLCGQSIEQEFIGNQWTLQNAVSTFVHPPSPQNKDIEIPVSQIKKFYMHATCTRLALRDNENLNSWSVRLT